ncbi:hypothetical protein [Polyangium sp. y55x31]|uniref:hypothetical protein n=1 Tax=Polyangium sp. y55x31 TaxID=3042688 RepID=UPI0024831584|nr:hypothetical protein [Polyangium sp. y55x31]MDI1481663.1 hypothetical protein [Polyangium sp. y55x31]
MNRMSWLLVVPLALVSALSVPAGCVEFDTYIYDKTPYTGGTGGNGGDGGGGNGGVGGTGGTPMCTEQGDCPETECRIGGSCNAGTCSWTTVNMPGTPVGPQVYGDCKQRECTAQGDITEDAVADLDVYDWGDPCYKDACSAWTNPQPDSGVSCTTKWGKAGLCGANFNCVECTDSADCAGFKCDMTIGKCVPSHCVDNSIQDSGETDVNCGGPCAPCAEGLKCALRTDCVGDGQCVGTPKICQAPTCMDNVKNGDETGPDCGGSCAQKCKQDAQHGCLVPDDCDTGLSCKAGKCVQ